MLLLWRMWQTYAFETQAALSHVRDRAPTQTCSTAHRKKARDKLTANRILIFILQSPNHDIERPRSNPRDLAQHNP